MSDISEIQVREALKSVAYGEKAQNIISLNMVNDIQIGKNSVVFTIVVDPKDGASLEPMRLEAEKAVRHILPETMTVMAILTAERKGEPPPITPNITARKKISKPETPFLPQVRKVIAVASGKGGVGKSTVATNLALALSKHGLAVGLCDADIYGPSLPTMMGLHQRPDLDDDKKIIPPQSHGIKVMSMGFMVEPEKPIIWRGLMVQSAVTQLMRDVAWGALDILVIDMPPGTGDAQLTIAQQIDLAGAIIVSTPQDVALIDARKGLEMFRTMNVPILGVIENMSFFICDHCGTSHDIFGHDGAKHEAEKAKVPFLGAIPITKDIRIDGDKGLPIVFAQPNHESSKAFMMIAQNIKTALHF